MCGVYASLDVLVTGDTSLRVVCFVCGEKRRVLDSKANEADVYDVTANPSELQVTDFSNAIVRFYYL